MTGVISASDKTRQKGTDVLSVPFPGAFLVSACRWC
ncbi:hypothetical protein ABIE59_002460 [Marinobacter sp. MBR-99]|jgi:hypothetical protein